MSGWITIERELAGGLLLYQNRNLFFCHNHCIEKVCLKLKPILIGVLAVPKNISLTGQRLALSREQKGSALGKSMTISRSLTDLAKY